MDVQVTQSKDVAHGALVMLRFNPDSYEDQDGKRIPSCWVLNKTGVCSVLESRKKAWKSRIDTLVQQIQYWVTHPTTKTVEIVELFY